MVKLLILNTFPRYDRFVIRSIVIAAYTGWAAYAALFVFLPETLSAAQTFHRPFLTNMIATSVLFTFWAIFWIQRSPWTFYVYITFPCYFWNRVALHTARPLYSRVHARSNNFFFYGRQFVLVGLVISTLLCMVVSVPRPQLQCQSSWMFIGCLHSSVDMEFWFCGDGCCMAIIVVA